MQSATEVQTHILLKVAEDAAFRERLIQDPKGTIEEETGLAVPDDAMIFVNQAIADAQKQEKAQDAVPLTKDELTQVAGGEDAACQGDWDDSHLECRNAE